jgi:hypothetical protein
MRLPVAYYAGASFTSLLTTVLSTITQLITVSYWCKFVINVDIQTVAHTVINCSDKIADVIRRKLSFGE